MQGDTNMERHIANQYGARYSAPLSHSFDIFHPDGSVFSSSESHAINQWLSQDTYHPFYVIDDTDASENYIYYAIFTEITDFAYNGLNGKHVTMMCNSSFGYTQPITKSYTVNGEKTVKLLNQSDDGDYYPTVQIIAPKNYNGSVKLKNTANDKDVVTYTLNDIDVVNERKILNIDTERGLITDGNNKLIPLYKLGISCNSKLLPLYWFHLYPARNTIQITTDAEVIVKMTFSFPRKVGLT